MNSLLKTEIRNELIAINNCSAIFSKAFEFSSLRNFLLHFFLKQIVEIYRNRETRHECIPTKNSHRNKDRKTNILDLRALNYGIICTEKCKKSHHSASKMWQSFCY